MRLGPDGKFHFGIGECGKHDLVENSDPAGSSSMSSTLPRA
jgi:hypothetical protein